MSAGRAGWTPLDAASGRGFQGRERPKNGDKSEKSLQFGIFLQLLFS
jgi:hypothetical protein